MDEEELTDNDKGKDSSDENKDENDEKMAEMIEEQPEQMSTMNDGKIGESTPTMQVKLPTPLLLPRPEMSKEMTESAAEASGVISQTEESITVVRHKHVKQYTDPPPAPRLIEFEEDDPTLFFRSVLRGGDVQEGDVVRVSPQNQAVFFDPINGKSPIVELRITKIFKLSHFTFFFLKKKNSNARPLRVECHVKKANSKMKKEKGGYAFHALERSSEFILKTGDDLRRDVAVQMMFQLMNAIWSGSNSLRIEGQCVEIVTYQCTPMGPDFGLIEYVSGCTQLAKLKTIKNRISSSSARLCRLIATAVGSYIGAYVMVGFFSFTLKICICICYMQFYVVLFLLSFICIYLEKGIRDRHHDNVLVRDSDGALVSLCFCFFYFVLNFADKKKKQTMVHISNREKTAVVDTNAIAITPALKKLMGKRWDDFIELGVRAFVELRSHYSELIDFARILFPFLAPIHEVEDFIMKQLKCDRSIEEASSTQEHEDKDEKYDPQYRTKDEARIKFVNSRNTLLDIWIFKR
ncbi:phosphatidylinositol-45-bisphosphate 3-kinase catalytic subunit alpha PI3K [Reticulomyxa filosa]|uniref:Phosphatidylinositol-45-bisphosphate 3-kinase catalytic subunit alpha PI3K n=1 Tax=Reticulomyxa filosa TaxID=46433 RepID=X6M1W0_RETFI|nr:phosphatidylinositol-45-bisphosphate 3-kinase catalytic subunit alpha PI3K [Reticulomyxa filosa]|eukprot:ETO07372.1 phosphatidylinositol-45-bisphosphate 3-kinase catalytic subunit alpha PI3K [Reticulomyxa filosa]